MFRVVPPPIIRSTYNCMYSIWYLLHRYCYLPLSWKSWNWFECAVGGIRHCCTCYGWYLHQSSGAHTTVSTASGIFYTVTAIYRYRGRVGTGLIVLWVAYATALHASGGTSTRHQEHVQLYLQHLVFVTPLLLSAAIVEELEQVWVWCRWRTPLLYMLRVVPPPVIRSTYNCIYSIWYLSHRYCYLPLSWKRWTWFECAVGGVR
jgi:hypothetical protein